MTRPLRYGTVHLAALWKASALLLRAHLLRDMRSPNATQTHTDDRVLLQAYKDLTEVMANQQDLVDIEHRLLPMLNVKVRPGLVALLLIATLRPTT